MPWSTALLAEGFLLEQEGGWIMRGDVSAVYRSWGGQEALLCITQLGKSHRQGC